MDTQLTNTIEILKDLIGFPTVSADSNLDLINYTADRLNSCGADVQLFHNADKSKANLFATLGPKIDGGIVLSGHTDVVPVTGQNWNTDPFTLHENDNLLYGRGSCDMKGFIAACIAMAPYFAQHSLTRPLHFAFTYDEETGCFGARDLVAALDANVIRPSVAIVGEPTSMRVIEGHKGCFEYTTHFKGLPGHGSAPDLGVNAVEYAARFVGRLLDLKDQLRARAPRDSRFQPPWTTVNTGRLEGGNAHNVIAAEATLEWEMRPVQASDASFVKSDLEAYTRDVLLPAMRAVDPDASIETEIVAEVEGLEPAGDTEAKRIVSELTGANGADVVAFGTEAGIFNKYGMSAIVCGPGSIDQAHKADEYVSLDQLDQCLKMLTKLADRL